MATKFSDIRDLTTLNWRKKFYYTSDDVIINAEKFQDEVGVNGTYLICQHKGLSDALKSKWNSLADGGVYSGEDCAQSYLDGVVPEVLIIVKKVNDSSVKFIHERPLQALIEEGDHIFQAVQYVDVPDSETGDVDDEVPQVNQHYPEVYMDSYITKYHQLVYDAIRPMVTKGYSPTMIMKSLPGYLTKPTGTQMTLNYYRNYFLKGKPWDDATALANQSADNYLVELWISYVSAPYHLPNPALPVAYGFCSNLGIWNKTRIEDAVQAIRAELVINGHNNWMVNNFDLALDSEVAEAVAQQLVDKETSYKAIETAEDYEEATTPMTSIFTVDYDAADMVAIDKAEAVTPANKPTGAASGLTRAKEGSRYMIVAEAKDAKFGVFKTKNSTIGQFEEVPFNDTTANPVEAIDLENPKFANGGYAIASNRPVEASNPEEAAESEGN